MLSKFVSFCKRFWWILVALAAVLFFWIKGLMHKARISEGLREQIRIESDIQFQYESNDIKTRAARRALTVEIQKANEDWGNKKKEIEDEISRDRKALEAYWYRAFGPSSDDRSESSES